MSNALPPSPLAVHPSPDPNENENDEINNSDGPSDTPTRTNGSRSASRSRRRRKRKTKPNNGLIKKLQFMTCLLKSLDTLIFAELAVLYYMECSLVRFSLRAIPHYAFLTPKSEALPIVLRAHPSHVISILLPNAICMLIHLFMSLPKGSELTRGHLHGGILIDFIGQKPPTTRLAFLSLDLIILAIQCLMLAVHSDREALKSASARPNRMLDILSTLDREVRGSRTQDDEERGVPSRNPLQNFINETVNIEMRSLRQRVEHEETTAASGTEREAYENNAGEGTSLVADSTAPPAVGRRQLEDIYASGNAIIGNFHVVHSLRSASTDYGSAAAHSIRTLGYATALAAFMAQQRGQTLGRSPR